MCKVLRVAQSAQAREIKYCSNCYHVKSAEARSTSDEAGTGEASCSQRRFQAPGLPPAGVEEILQEECSAHMATSSMHKSGVVR